MSSFGQYLVSGYARDSGRSVSAEDRVGQLYPTLRPHVTQYFQPFSSSPPQAGQREIERLCPQLGQ